MELTATAKKTTIRMPNNTVINSKEDDANPVALAVVGSGSAANALVGIITNNMIAVERIAKFRLVFMWRP